MLNTYERSRTGGWFRNYVSPLNAALTRRSATSSTTSCHRLRAGASRGPGLAGDNNGYSMNHVGDLAEHLNESIRARNLLRRDQRVVVAVSGGVDSMALLHLLRDLAPANSWKLIVAHLNHSLRGRSSDADERLVVRTAKKLGLPVVVERAAVREFAAARKLSIEMAARMLRHQFLAAAAVKAKARTIAVAHHADDQIELFFLRLLRGSGGDGLGGMKWRAPSPTNAKIELIRPLLAVSKAALIEYAASGKLPFREDASNASLDIQRNRVRHELLPLLRKSYQPGLDRTIPRVMEILSAENEFVGMAASEAMGTGEPFGDLPVALQRRWIQMRLQEQGCPADFELIDRLRTAPERAVSISSGLTVRLDRSGGLHFEANISFKAKGISSEIHFNDHGRNGGTTEFEGVNISWRLLAKGRRSLPGRKLGREWFDAALVGPKFVLRHWRPGDRFQPIGMGAAVKLQDLFVNQRITRKMRHELIVAEAASGEIFWVENLRISEKFKVASETRQILEWRWKRL